MEMASDDHLEETDKINVVPLADLSLVLLIVLMVISPMVMSSMIKVSTPNVEKSNVKPMKEKTPDPLLIKITYEGLFLNNNLVDSEEFLAEQIAIKLFDDPERPVILSSEDNIQVGVVVRILDLARQNGAERVSLVKGSPSK